MATSLGRSSSVPSLPPPSPKSPPEYPDLYGKRREMARVQMLEREISFLEEELKSVEGLQPASRCCKEMAEFVVANSDPLLLTKKKNRRSRRFWKWLCGMPCFNLSWICCCCCCFEGCSFHIEMPRCCDCKPSCRCLPSITCALPKCCWCCSWPPSNCCKKRCKCKNCCISPNCCVFPNCCIFQCPSCPPCCCSCKCSCSCTCPGCPKVRPCCCCTKSCWKSCCLCCY